LNPVSLHAKESNLSRPWNRGNPAFCPTLILRKTLEFSRSENEV
jgi:hypothetical protein